MDSFNLDNAWRELSAMQADVASWVEGPLLVLAGPGSGKTRVLTCRIAKILNSSRNENFRILALTFTNKAADEMRTRVMDFVPGKEGRLFIGTFHSFCSDVLRQHGMHLGIDPKFTIYGHERDLTAVFSDAMDKIDGISESEKEVLKKTLPVIQRLKSRLIAPDQCGVLFDDEAAKNRIPLAYSAYELQLAKRNALDFDSLIFKTYQLFIQFPAFTKRYRTVYRYICVDEFQDTNEGQYKLIRALTGDYVKNLFIVADEDQIIYQWNGASFKRIEQLIKDYNAEVIQLPVNYRCPFEVVKLANNLIRHNFSRRPGKQPLKAHKGAAKSTVVRLLSGFHKFSEEANGIACDIRNLHSGHFSSIVILGRTHRLLEDVKNALIAENIPAIISQRKDDFDSPPFVWLCALLGLANDRMNKDYLELTCGSYHRLTGINIDPDIILGEAQLSNRDYFQQWVWSARKDINRNANSMPDEAFGYLGGGKEFVRFIDYALDWFATILQIQNTEEEGSEEVRAAYLMELSAWRELMREISDSLGDNITLGAFLQEMQLRSKEPPPTPNTVRLMTIHGAKGKEFDHVYLAGLVEDELPSFQSIRKGDHSPEMEEERRNCFVAITRTIRTLTLSYSGEMRGWPKKPSRFLYDMGLLSD